MTSRIRILPLGDKEPESVLDRLYGPGYVERLRSRKVGAHGLQAELLGGVADEFGAGVGSLADWVYGQATMDDPPALGDLYDARLAEARREQEAYREEHPYLSIGANVLGAAAVAPAKVAGAAAEAPGLMTRLGVGAKSGAIGGGASGFAEGKEGFANRARMGALGAGAGATLGAGMPLAVSAVRGLTGAVARGMGMTGRGAGERARRLFAEALEKDGVSLEDLAAVTAERPLTLADLGPNSRALLGRAYRGSEGARKLISDFLNQRQDGQFDRLMRDLGEGLGEDPAAFGATTSKLVADKAKASPLYNQLRGQTVAPDEEIDAILSTPAGRRAYDLAQDWWANKGNPMPDDGRIPFDVIDQTKKNLDKIARYGETPAGGAEIGDVGAIRDLNERLRKWADGAFPGYRAARAASADPHRALDVLNAGRKFLRGDTEDLGVDFAKLTDVEKELFRLGAARELAGKFGKRRDTNDLAQFFENPDMRGRLATIFPSRAEFDKFMSAVGDESAMNLTRTKTMTGSQTAERLADDVGGVGGDIAGLAVDAAGGGGAATAANALRRTLSAAGKGAQRALDERLGEEVAQIGTRTDIGDVGPRLANLPGPRREFAPAPMGEVPALGRIRSAPGSVATGGVIGRGLTPDERQEAPQSRIKITHPAGQGRISINSDPLKTTGGHVNLENVGGDTKRRLIALQRRWGADLPISSGYRDPAYNAKVGGAKKSRHMHGDALDIDLTGMPPDKRLRLINMASEVGFTGIGIYDNSIHLDMGGRRAWGPSYKSDSVPQWAQPVIKRHLSRK